MGWKCISCESFADAIMTWLNVTEYLCHRWPRICPVFRSRNTGLNFFSYDLPPIFNKSNTTGVTSRTETTYSSGVPEFTKFFSRVSSFLCVVWRSLFVVFIFLLAIAISVLLQLIGPDYPFGIFFLTTIWYFNSKFLLSFGIFTLS